MKLFILSIILCLAFTSASAQERTITGRLTSNEDGSPLPGINITIKGTSTGTSTDANGNYSITVPIGSTMVFSFIGMQTREVLVTKDNLQPVRPGSNTRSRDVHKKMKSPDLLSRSLYQDSIPQDKLGLATLTSESPSYTNKSPVDPSAIRKIKKSGNRYVLKSDSDPYTRTGFGLQFSSSLSLEKINKLPSLQNTYTQGQPSNGKYQWIGADQQELFSWGPQIATLEYDGSSYPYDKNGRLVTIGSGNGNIAKKYNAKDFFRIGVANVNELMLTLPGKKHSTFVFDLENRRRSGIIPNSDFERINIGASMKNFKLAEHLTTNTTISYNRSNGNLLSRGANLASIVGAVYRTPTTFDNANGHSAKSARNHEESYKLTDGTQRSHAPGYVDNPYGLANDLPDNDHSERFLASLNLRHSSSNPLSIVLNTNVDAQWNRNYFGVPLGYSAYINGRLTERNEQQTFANLILTPTYRFELYDSELKVGLSYQSQYTNREIERLDGFNFLAGPFNEVTDADSLVQFKRYLHRMTHEIIVNAQYEYYDLLNVKFTNRIYFSSTVRNGAFSNFFPSGNIILNLAQLVDIWSIEYLRLYSTASRTIREAPLLFSNWSYGSTNSPVENYTSFYEANEILFNRKLLPEIETKLESGLKFRGMSSRLSVEIAYFNNVTKDFIAPAQQGTQYALQNLATIRNYGGTASAGYTGYMYNGSWGTEVRWSKYNAVVRELSSADESIALAGFQSIRSVLAEDKPLGAIYGTTYRRNSNGDLIIGEDGFPLEDASLTMIGNPIPDFLLGWSGYVRWKQFNFSFQFDLKSGGDMWNGTNAALDYLGRSASSGSERNISNYIYTGVDGNNNQNVQPVSFSDPNKSVNENRWVRYGWDGVGEDYIEDASWFRLSEIVFSYSLRLPKSKVQELKCSLVARNLFLITPYSGVDPAATLFSYNTGNGLDLFNTPSTRSYGIQITVRL
ncbi:MAG TPA: carboxypeptidase-like regulatory domain-containing protein [Chryseolinea sp.]